MTLSDIYQKCQTGATALRTTGIRNTLSDALAAWRESPDDTLAADDTAPAVGTEEWEVLSGDVPTGPEHPDVLAVNERYKSEFHVYYNTEGYYQDDGTLQQAAAGFTLTAGQIQTGYSATKDACIDQAQSEQEVQAYEDMAMYYRAHDAAYLASLSPEGLNKFMAKYQSWESDHMMEDPETGVRNYVFGMTADEYSDMDSVSKANYDAKMGMYQSAWTENFGNSFRSYVQEPSVINQQDEPSGSKSGFWENLKTTATGVMSKAREMISSTPVGAWVVEKLDAIHDRVSGFMSGRTTETPASEREVPDISFEEEQSGTDFSLNM